MSERYLPPISSFKQALLLVTLWGDSLSSFVLVNRHNFDLKVSQIDADSRNKNQQWAQKG